MLSRGKPIEILVWLAQDMKPQDYEDTLTISLNTKMKKIEKTTYCYRSKIIDWNMMEGTDISSPH